MYNCLISGLADACEGKMCIRDSLRGMLYEDMKDGIISKEDYKELHAAYEQRKKNPEIAIHQIALEMDDVFNRKSKGFVWLDYFTEHKNIEKLTREVVVLSLIHIYERFSFEDFSYNNDNFWHIWFKYASVSFHYCPIY